MQFPRNRFLPIAAIAVGLLTISSCDQSSASNPTDPTDDAAARVQAAASTVSAPTFSPGAGTYTSVTSVTLKSSTSGATIYYTLDGTTPTTNSTKYTAPISLGASRTIKAIAVKSGSNNSSVASGVYTIQLPAAAPTFTPAAGTYAVAQTLALRSTTAGATIYYTTNGTAPTTASSVYTAPFMVGTTETIKAFAAAKGFTNSPVASSSYTLNLLTPTTITGAGNSLSGPVTATLKANQSGAVLSYSTDKVHWTYYQSAGILVTSSEILYAKDSLDGVSLVDSTIFLFAPVITPLSGGYTAAQTVSIKDLGAVSIQYYTGAIAPSTWNTYSGPLSVAACTQLHTRATLGSVTSNVVSATYAFPPSISPSYGTYADKRSVSVTATGADAVQVSTDGATWATVSSPFTVTTNGTYYFRSEINGIFSTNNSGSYNIIHDTTLQSVAISAGSYKVNPPISGTTYTIGTDSLPELTTAATVTATPTDGVATVTINGGTSGIVNLVNGVATVAIKVVNGPSSQTYTLRLYSKQEPTFVDARDGQTYPMVQIGTQTWMAKNLNHWYSAGDGVDTFGVCYNYSQDSCQKYGRLYTWAEAMQGASSSNASPSGVQGICPSGWHLPSEAEMATLQTYASGQQSSNTAAVLMSSGTAWGTYAGTNTTGFNGLPAGYLYAPTSSFANIGGYTWWWTSSFDPSSGEAYNLGIQGSDQSIHMGEDLTANAHSVRCIAN